MSVISTNIVRITDFQLYQGKQILNVYHYYLDALALTPDLTALGNEFTSQVLTAVRAAQNPNLVHFRLLVEQINHGLPFVDISHSLPGTKAGGNDAPTWVAVSYKFTRGDKSTRNGGKRIAGLDESDFTGNNLTAACIAAHTPALIEMISGHVLPDGTWRPMILGKPTGNPNEYYFNVPTSGSLIRPELKSQDTRM